MARPMGWMKYEADAAEEGADAEEHGDHEVAGQHVEEQPEAERDQPHQLREHLDERDQTDQQEIATAFFQLVTVGRPDGIQLLKY